MKKYLTKIILLSIYSISSAFGAIAPEPFSDSSLEEYGLNPNFKATVQLNDGCSASRILLDKELPFDLYITAAHCFDNHEDESEDLSEKFSKFAFNRLLEEAKDFSSLSKLRNLFKILLAHS